MTQIQLVEHVKKEDAMKKLASIIGLCFLPLVLAACGTGQSDICKQYISCEKHAAEIFQRAEMQTFAYGPNAICWETDELANDCNTLCEDTVTSLRDSLNDKDLELGPCAAER